MKTVKVSVGLVASMLVLSGCATNGSSTLGNALSPTGTALIQIGVDVAVQKAVGTDPATQKVIAQKIATIAEQILTLDQGTSVAITVVEAAVDARIATMNLPPADLQVAQILTQTLGTYIQSALAPTGTVPTTTGTVTSTTQVAVAMVLNDVIQICRTAYGST